MNAGYKITWEYYDLEGSDSEEDEEEDLGSEEEDGFVHEEFEQEEMSAVSYLEEDFSKMGNEEDSVSVSGDEYMGEDEAGSVRDYQESSASELEPEKIGELEEESGGESEGADNEEMFGMERYGKF